MGHVILGLLLIGEHTLYSLKKHFEGGISLFYSASVGSIKRALDALLDAGLIRVSSAEGGPRGKKTYAVTEAGRAEFRSWMRSPVAGTGAETTALARTFFLGLLEPEEQGGVLAAIITRTEQDLQNLRALARRLDAAEPAAAGAVFRHQRATLDYGIGAHEFALEWFRGHARRLGGPPRSGDADGSASAGPADEVAEGAADQRPAAPPSSIR